MNNKTEELTEEELLKQYGNNYGQKLKANNQLKVDNDNLASQSYNSQKDLIKSETTTAQQNADISNQILMKYLNQNHIASGMAVGQRNSDYIQAQNNYNNTLASIEKNKQDSIKQALLEQNTALANNNTIHYNNEQDILNMYAQEQKEYSNEIKTSAANNLSSLLQLYVDNDDGYLDQTEYNELKGKLKQYEGKLTDNDYNILLEDYLKPYQDNSGKYQSVGSSYFYENDLVGKNFGNGNEGNNFTITSNDGAKFDLEVDKIADNEVQNYLNNKVSNIKEGKIVMYKDKVYLYTQRGWVGVRPMTNYQQDRLDMVINRLKSQN
ncbi:MAG: hypothetical protein IJW82_06800 [Clostridia bacterium]|nr:hypothetical protein [Clostridia bacterium]